MAPVVEVSSSRWSPGVSSRILMPSYTPTEEGAFSMVTLWLIEALARAGAYDPTLLAQSVGMLEDFMGYTNHVDLLSEEISKGGEPLGNFPQVSCTRFLTSAGPRPIH